MNAKRVLTAVLLVILVAGTSVTALIKLDVTVSKVYQEESKIVLTGKVAAIREGQPIVEVAVVDALKGKTPAEKLFVRCEKIPDVLKQVAVGQSVVFFLGDGGGAVHIADTWLLVQMAPKSEMKVWVAVQVKNDFKQAYPGSSAGLAQVAAAIKTGRATLLNKWEHKPFAGGVQKGTKLPVQKPAWVMSGDVNGDKKADLIAGAADGVKLFLGENFSDASEAWGLPKIAAKFHAIGDVDGDGKLDLVLDDTIWLNNGQKFTASAQKLEFPKGVPLSAAIADLNDDKKADVLLLGNGGELLVFENGGATWTKRPAKNLWENRTPDFATIGDFGENGKIHVLTVDSTGASRYDIDGGKPADMLRLTAVDFSKDAKFSKGLKSVGAVPLNMDKDGRIDFFVTSEAGSFLLINRGYGAYFLDEATDEPLKGVQISPATPMTRIDRLGDGLDDLVIIAEDGTVTVVSNGPH